MAAATWLAEKAEAWQQGMIVGSIKQHRFSQAAGCQTSEYLWECSHYKRDIPLPLSRSSLCLHHTSRPQVEKPIMAYDNNEIVVALAKMWR